MQVLNRMTYVATLSHLRRVNTPIEKTGKLVQPRKLHPTQYGVVCPAETPEGASVGLVKNLALLTGITIETPSDPVHQALVDIGVVFFMEPSSTEAAKQAPGAAVEAVFGGGGRGCVRVRVLVNGDIVGSHDDPVRLLAELRALKRSGALGVFTSISWSPVSREITICTEGGRFVRPVLVVDPETGLPAIDAMPELADAARKGTAPWYDLVRSGAVEYLDVDESNGALIAMTRDGLKLQSTHMEISPSVMLGVVAGSIPYSDHNQVTFSLPRQFRGCGP